jgi:NAD-dependent deacetylase
MSRDRIRDGLGAANVSEARAREALAVARSIVVLTGAGISAESGIPTFRDAMTGLWARYRPEDLATPEAFQRDPRTVWDWYAWRRERVATVAPNAGHEALARLERQAAARGASFLLVTQNVDGLHAAAGSRNLVELHGNIRRVKCFDRGHPALEWPREAPAPPPCADCGSPLRPDVVWFGEALPPEALRAALEATAGCDLFLSVGTSGLVEPAASLPYAALERGAAVIEVNPQPTPLAQRAWAAFAGRAGEVLPRLVPLESGA